MSEGLVFTPFRGLRYDAEHVGSLAAVTCPPYDVLDTPTAVRLAAHPHSVVRLVLPHTVDPADPAPHAAAAARLAAWRRRGVLRTDPTPAFYVYEETEAGRVHRGVLGALALPRTGSPVVLPHEATREATVVDRLALLAATETDLEPILLIPDSAGPAFSAVLDAGDAAAPGSRVLAEFRTEDGLGHRLISVTDPTVTAAVSGELRSTRALLADGHHRFEAARRLHPDGVTLVLLADPATAPRVNPIHRVVPGLAPAAAADRAAAAFAVESLPLGDADTCVERLRGAGETTRAFVVGDTAAAYLLVGPDPRTLGTTVPPERPPAWRELDVVVAHATLLRALWGVPDDEDHVEVSFAAGDALRRAAQIGGTAVLLNPPPLAAIKAVADSGELMPRKSTFFTPKPRTGLVLRPLRDDVGSP
ncbi:MAG TPA: DUF1015 domain-containing protein [Mycobacteriales bacterium]|nr:DUF1015 domain-containing protein [Mycobacteriales bacterium]